MNHQSESLTPENRGVSKVSARSKSVLAALILILAGLWIYAPRIKSSYGFIFDDSTHVENSYSTQFRINPVNYLPGVTAHRPIGRDAITLLLKLFGEDLRIIWTMLFVHIASSVIVWWLLYRLFRDWWAALGGGIFFLLNIAAYLPVYWPGTMFDLLSTFFLACLAISIIVILQPAQRSRGWMLLLTLSLYIAAVKSKESAIVSFAPVALLMIFASDERPTLLPAGLIRLRQSLKQRGVWNWILIWIVAGALLGVVLALTVASDARGSDNPTHPYHREYSLSVIGRSMGYFISTLFFTSDNPEPIKPWIALLVLGIALVAALLLRNKWMLVGWSWFMVFLLPLATLVNHYAYSYYLYPANIGTAIYIAGLFHEISRRLDGYRVVRRIGIVLPALFSLVLVQQMSSWLAHSNAVRWYDDLHNDRAHAIESLKSVLPHPQPDSEIVVVYPRILHLVTYSPSFIRVIFHDLTLTGELFFNESEAKTYLAKQNDGRNVYLASWQDDRFIIERSDDPRVPASAPSPHIVRRLTLRDFGPSEVVKGKPFNVQPDGVSAIWASSVNATSTTVLVINGKELRSIAQPDGRLVTAGVPNSVFAESGVFPIYLLDRSSGEKSDEKQFVVK